MSKRMVLLTTSRSQILTNKKMDFAYSSGDPALFAGFNQSQQLINDS